MKARRKLQICHFIADKKCYRTQLLNQHINVVTNHELNSDNLFILKRHFIEIAKLYICIVSVNIFAKYSYFRPIHINGIDERRNINNYQSDSYLN